MFAVSLALAAAALPTPFAPTDREDLRCVAVLAVVAHEQAAGLWRQTEALATDGPRYAAHVGDSLVDRGIARDAVRDLLLAQARALQTGGPLKRATVDVCVSRMHVAVPPISLNRCAALMTRAADLAQTQEPGTENTRQLAALAPVIVYRAQLEGQTTAQLATERERVAREPSIDGGELDACARLAVEPKK